MALAENLNPQHPPVLRLVDEDDEHTCQDCRGALIIVDDDGSISGRLGSLVDCGCVALSVPPGFVECGACASLIPVVDPRLDEYLDFCAATGTEPAWCLRCGDYRPLANGTRPPCECAAGRRRSAGKSLGSFTIVGPWGHER
jgi:hypothetical protein